MVELKEIYFSCPEGQDATVGILGQGSGVTTSVVHVVVTVSVKERSSNKSSSQVISWRDQVSPVISPVILSTDHGAKDHVTFIISSITKWVQKRSLDVVLRSERRACAQLGLIKRYTKNTNTRRTSTNMNLFISLMSKEIG